MFVFLPLFSNLALAAELFSVPEMTCEPCETEIKERLKLQSTISIVGSSYQETWICLDGEYDSEQLKEFMGDVGYTFLPQEGECPVEQKHLWADFEEEAKGNPKLDFQIVSTGERFKMKRELSKGKFTVFDFGADWCGICHSTAKQLQDLMGERDDLAVRAIHLPGNEDASFAHPVVFQYLYEAPGLPWFVLYGPDKKKLYEGHSYDDLLSVLTGDQP